MVDSLTNIKLPKDINDIAAFIDNTKIDEILMNAIPELWNTIKDAASKKIAYRREEFLKKSKTDELFDALISLIKHYSEIFESVDINEVLTKLSSVSDLAKLSDDRIVKGILDYNKKEAGTQPE